MRLTMTDGSYSDDGGFTWFPPPYRQIETTGGTIGPGTIFRPQTVVVSPVYVPTYPTPAEPEKPKGI